MKKILSSLALAALTVGLLGSCSKINERIDNLEKKVDGIESNQIASIKSQVDAINTSIADLGTIRQNVQTLMDTAPSTEDIEELRKADEALGRRIDELKSYTDGELTKYATTEWVKATFATLEQHQWTCDTIAKIDARIGALDANLTQSISGLESSLKQWVNEQLDAYYTAAQMDAKLDVMRNDIDNAKAQGKAATDKADSLATELTTLKTAVDAAKANIRSEYKAAVQSAIETSEGKLSQALKDSIGKVNDKITALDARVTTLEGKVLALEGKVDKLLAMIQSMTIVPAYSDGSVESTKDGVLHLDIIVTPAEAVAAITKDSLKVLVNEVKTKAVGVDTVAVTKFKVDAAKGTITARADISSKLPKDSKKELTVAVNVKNGLSDFTTKFCPVTLSTESNVTVKDETDTTKVTIKADEDFPESSAGNIVVADGFKDSKPTTVDIEVGGKGTVIFDAKATSQIKANAVQAGAKSVFFKVEDVTTTKPVENADVVLEVTMKTVDENGTEVFSEDNAGEGAEVTIEIPIPEEKDVVFVNSVTLVNDAGEPIEGGVVPGSEDFDKEKGILSFKVNHFSKYAIDYVTSGQFVEVTGVSIEPVSVTLQVGDTLRLVANITPEDATNKKVTWSSSDTTKVTVDNTGKITAVAFGQATITVTTKDGNKTADCTVKVSETKTMADILKTTTGIPESQELTPPANAWVHSTDPDCKAFVGIDAGGDTLFVILKEGLSNPPAVCMDDAFERIDDNTYKRTEPDFTFTVKMTGGKFTSLEFNTNIERIEFLNGTYAAPKPVVPEGFVDLGVKDADGKPLYWAEKNLGASKAEDYGDYFAWGETAPYYTTTGGWPATPTWKLGKTFGYMWYSYCGQSSFVEWSTPPYDATSNILKPEFDAATAADSSWRTPTKDEFVALAANCVWIWTAGYNSTGKAGYIVYKAKNNADKGKANMNGTWKKWNGSSYNDDSAATGSYSIADTHIFFPAAGFGDGSSLYDAGSYGDYWSSSLYTGNAGGAYSLSFGSGRVGPQVRSNRYCGFSVRLVTEASDAGDPGNGTEQYKNNSNPNWF